MGMFQICSFVMRTRQFPCQRIRNTARICSDAAVPRLATQWGESDRELASSDSSAKCQLPLTNHNKKIETPGGDQPSNLCALPEEVKDDSPLRNWEIKGSPSTTKTRSPRKNEPPNRTVMRGLGRARAFGTTARVTKSVQPTHPRNLFIFSVVIFFSLVLQSTVPWPSRREIGLEDHLPSLKPVPNYYLSGIREAGQ